VCSSDLNIAVKGKTGEYMGYYQMNAALSFLLAPAVGAWIFDSFGSFNLWIASFVLSLISGFALIANKKLSVSSK
jgi:MFS family permease